MTERGGREAWTGEPAAGAAPHGCDVAGGSSGGSCGAGPDTPDVAARAPSATPRPDGATDSPTGGAGVAGGRGRARSGSRRGAPLGFVPVAVVAVAFLSVPLLGLVLRTPWRQMPAELSDPGVLTALKLSMICSLGALGISLVLGIPLAWVLARVPFRGSSIVRALVILPMVLPPVVGGVALLLAFGRQGLVGQWLDSAFGITLPFSIAGAMIAEAFVAMPFLVITVEAGLRAMDRRYEDAAATLGAGRWTTFRRVTLPLIAPSLGAGAALCWARALGEFGATITFAGNLPGKTQTMPLAVYIALQSNTEAAIALSLVLLVVSLAILVALRGRWFPSVKTIRRG